MADPTQDAVGKLLGLLATAIKDEAQLQGGLPGNMQFIKDEMDSMNGFLLHLTKTEREHNDQIRAWMKQVREIANIAEDCVRVYVRHRLHEGDGGVWTTAYFLLLHPKKWCRRHRLAKQILELKARVNDVGERRLRYGVQVPAGSDLTLDGRAAQEREQEKRERFRDALRQGMDDYQQEAQAQASPPIYSTLRKAVVRLLVPDAVPPFVTKAIGDLPADSCYPGAAALVRATWKKLRPSPPPAGDEALRCIEMLLCALFVYPHKQKTNKNVELERLERKLETEEGGAAEEDIKKQVMLFCYSLLSAPQKSCLQYLTAFLEESAISRTSLVRRWVAEGLVGKEPGRTTPEEAGEGYFRELLFRGFIRPARVGDAGTVKSCEPLAGSISEFLTGIAASENFVAELPRHLGNQLRIRKIVRRPRPLPHHQVPGRCCRCWVGDLLCSCSASACWRCWRMDDAAPPEDPVEELMLFLRGLSGLYRLNVLDLGGCRGLEPRHMETICTVVWLKYLSLRNTDASRLPRDLKNLELLETLDIRNARIRADDIERMYLHKLKHLLAGRYVDRATGGDAPTARTSADLSVDTVQIPGRIGRMRDMETLSRVQVSDDGAELQRLRRLQNLRKLGVVFRRADGRTAEHLRAVMSALARCLRSLSIWVTLQGGALDIFLLQEQEATAGSQDLALENLDINGRCSSLPAGIERAGKLANVSLRETELSAGDTLTRLGNVPSLRCLKLSRRSLVEQAIVFRDVQFRALRFLVVDGDTITSVAFTEGAAPELHKIVWSISKAHSGDLITGIKHLGKLKEIELRGNFNVPTLMQAIGDPPPVVTKYRCRYVSSSDLNEIAVAKKTSSDNTLSLPVGVMLL